MSPPIRFQYHTLSPEAAAGFGAIKKALHKSTLGQPIIELVWMRVSQINGCVFCLEKHGRALRTHGESNAKIDSLAGWHTAGHFTARERVALAWAESLVHVDKTHAPDEDFEPLKEHFTHTEISDLTIAISLMSALNRLAIGTRK